MKAKKLLMFVTLTVVLAALVIWIVWGNTALALTTYTVTSTRLPECFNDYRIAHVSDLHNVQLGEDNEKLLTMLRDAEPDMIAITGDLVDSRNTNVEVALKFVREAVKIAPCYYVTGNHEARVNAYDTLKAGMVSAGVILLEDEQAEITIGNESITLIGVNDPSFQTDYILGDAETVMNAKLELLHKDGEGFTVLLSHRPELFDVYADHEIDLILSGHAHGGQFRLPFLGGVVAPNQGLFPKYDAGIFESGGTGMLVSRGVGNSIFPFRINNRPEVILVELKSDLPNG